MRDVFAFSSDVDMPADKRSSPGGALRKPLGDLSNNQPGLRSPTAERKSQFVPISAKDIDRLTKEVEALKRENLALKKQLVERNKITELSAAELQTLRVNLQNLYQQNLQLAKANSQMLAELNAGKDSRKVLRHELACMKAVLNGRISELQDEEKVVDCQQACSKPIIKSEVAEESLLAENTIVECTKTNKRRLSKDRRKSAAKDTSEKEKSERKRRCVRRQSSRFKPEEPASTEDDVKLPIYPQVDDTKWGDDSSIPVALSGNMGTTTGRNGTGPIVTDMRRMSIGRPLRRATEKLQSYKETPLNVKMRRPL